MKRLLLPALFCLLFVLSAFPQENAGKAQQLNQQMMTLFQQGNLDEAAMLAESIVKIQRDEQPSKPQNLVNSLENLAEIKLARFKREIAEMNSPDLNPKNSKTISEKLQSDATDSEHILREALGLAAKISDDPTPQLIGLKNNLAWLLYNFFPPSPDPSVGFDKQSRDKFDSLSRARFYKRTGEAESLYNDALKRALSLSNEESDISLVSLFNLSEFEMAMGNFEAAIPHYEKCIDIIEKKYGKNSKNLLPPMESYAKVLVATDQDDRAFDIVSRIVRITGKSMSMPKALLNVSLRSDSAFTTSNAPTVEQKALANKERIELGSRSSILASGVNGEAAFARIMAASTFGRSYYEDSNGIKLMRVAVRVLIDETGKVIEAEALTNDKDTKSEAEKIVKGWKFDPVRDGGQSRKLKGYVECLFLAEQFSK